MKKEPFVVETSHNGLPSIKTHECSEEQAELIRRIIKNNWSDSEDYKICHPCSPFLQGFDAKHGWVFVEFWNDDKDAIEKLVAHINQKLGLTENE